MSKYVPFSTFNRGGKFFRGKGRSDIRAANNIGIVKLDVDSDPHKYRDPELQVLDCYYENTQYAGMPVWDQTEDAAGNWVPVRKRQPRFKIPFAKSLAQRVGAKLVGDSVFPSFSVEDSPDDTAFIKAVIKESKLQSRILEPVRRMVNCGSTFLRFYLSGGAFKVEWFESKYCYPVFQDNGELLLLRYQYIYEDANDKDDNGNPKKKWYRLDLGTMSETLYDNPEYVENEEPQFQIVEQVDHGMGFVQGEWLRTSEEKDSPDGYGLCDDLPDFIDELNYSLSQSSQAVGYNQDPQLVLNKMDEDDIANFIRSATKSWNLGREGEAKFLETDLSGVEKAIELRDKVKLNISDITRVVLLDPEKVVGNAQSAKAMEVLYGPLVDLINELRGTLQDSLTKIVVKMSMAVLIASKQGIEVPIEIPKGYIPTSLDLKIDWPPIFQQTMEDLQKKVGVASTAKNSGLISPETAVRYVAKDFGVEDVDAELQKINEAKAAEAALNPFGGF